MIYMAETLTTPNYPDYPWYKTGRIEDFHRKDSDKLKTLQQGFLVFDCPIIDISSSLSNDFANLKDGEETEIIPEVKKVNLIIMTQSCDLANDKTEQVLLSAFFPASGYSNNEFKDIKSSRRVALCLIEESEDADINPIGFEKQVIDFRQVYTLPKEYILEFIGSKTIFGLLPPYREYVAQEFARFFMRVGKPMDFK